MRYIRNQCTIWEFVGGVSAINGLVCFALSTTYKISFGKLGIIGGLLFYLLLSSIMLYLVWWVKRVEAAETFQGHVKALIFIVICSISVMLDKLVPGKSDALSVISYGSFALMSLSTSRKCELGFETGFFSFFLSLFFQQLCKINLKLSPIALLFCLLVFVLRHYSESSEEQSGFITANVHPIEVGPPNENETVIEIGDKDINEEFLISQDSSGMGEGLGESVASQWTRARRRAAEEPQPQVVTVVLGVDLHCAGCANRIKRWIRTIEGVESVESDLKKSEVSVKGLFEAGDLVELVTRKTKKRVVIVKQEVEEKEKKDGGGKEEN